MCLVYIDSSDDDEDREEKIEGLVMMKQTD